VLVTGAGPIGLLAALLGIQRGLEVHVLDRVESGPKSSNSAKCRDAGVHRCPTGRKIFRVRSVAGRLEGPDTMADIGQCYREFVNIFE
jgi:2-polyprenyl-6-methoxyphenol hydroxylase-like FAD-dependent oxidoreductase